MRGILARFNTYLSMGYDSALCGCGESQVDLKAMYQLKGDGSDEHEILELALQNHARTKY